ncbi:MAG: flagellar biosynthesis protein, partial [Bacteroidetes bacterium]|nr:flagellar biosynthesis protein [Bacteroidota bacterium]
MAKKNFVSMAWAFIAISILLLGSGCATNRGILDVKVDIPQNPSEGKTIAIVRVTDIRQFEVAPLSPSVPSLRGDDIENHAITVRAIARKRNGYGKAIGDIVLPEGRTVEG